MLWFIVCCLLLGRFLPDFVHHHVHVYSIRRVRTLGSLEIINFNDPLTQRGHNFGVKM